MRTFVLSATMLTLAGGGLFAAVFPQAADQAAKPKVEAGTSAEPKTGTTPDTRTQKKTVVVERDGEDGPRVFSWSEDGGPSSLGFRTGGMHIGVSVANLDDEQAKAMTGVVVTGVNEDGPAAKAGVKEKDVITEFDGEKVRSAAQLSRLVNETPPGRTVKLAAMREGRRVDLQVTPEDTRLGMLEHDGPMMDMWTPDRMPRLHPGMPGGGPQTFRFEMPEGNQFYRHQGPGGPNGDDTFDVFIPRGRGRLGIGIQDLSDQLAEYFGTKDGVLVSSVNAESPAAKAGLRAGDVITSINDTAVTSTESLIAAVRKAEDGASIKVGYVRDKKPGTVTATLTPREKAKKPTNPV